MTKPSADWASDRNAVLTREYLTWLGEVRRRRAVTIYNYASKLESFLEHVGSRPLGDVTPTEVEAWLARPRGGKACGGQAAAATLHKDVSVLRGLYGFLQARGYVKRNPALLLGAPTIRNVHPKPIPDDVWRRLWECDRLPDEARVVLGLGFFVGLRRAEIIALAPHHVSVPAQRLVGFTRKGGGDDITPYGESVAVFTDCLPHLIGSPGSFLDPLHALVAARRGKDYLLPWGDELAASGRQARIHSLPEGMADPQRIYKKLWGWMKLAGVPTDAFSVHRLRHSTATNLLRAGVPIHLVSRLLNHSNISMTMRYTKAGGDELGEWRRANGGKALRLGDYNRHQIERGA